MITQVKCSPWLFVGTDIASEMKNFSGDAPRPIVVPMSYVQVYRTYVPSEKMLSHMLVKWLGEILVHGGQMMGYDDGC